jgi:hypothetical protein
MVEETGELGMYNSWVSLESFDFQDPELKEIHVDTRDFHISANKKLNDKVIKLSPSVVRAVSIEKIKETLIRFKAETGGEKDWRHFDIEDTKLSNCWDFKYLRFYKFDEAWYFIKDENFLPTDYLDKSSIDLTYKNWDKDKEPVIEQEFQTYEKTISDTDFFTY